MNLTRPAYLCLFFAVGICPAGAVNGIDLKSLAINDLYRIDALPQSTLELHVFALRSGKTTLGEIHTIAGEPPRLIEIKSLSRAAPEVSLLRYDAGTAGTSTLMQMDRVAILLRAPGQKNWKVIGDHAIALRRYQGIRAILELERMWEWDAKGLKIRFESFDEDPVVEYVWNAKDKNFTRNVR